MSLFKWTYEKEITDRQGDKVTRKFINFPGIATSVIIAVFATTVIFGSVYTVEEGHEGVVKRFSEAQIQVPPGLHFKIPFVDSVEAIEFRTRKNVEELAAATDEQMPVKAKVSVNWTVTRASILQLYKKYGGLEQFENRILDPRLRSASKTAISKYTAERLIKERNIVIGDIETRLTAAMEGFDVSLDSVQIENISLPKIYLDSIEKKQTAKNLADAEQFNLEKQALEAQRDVNVKTATAAGIKAISIEKAAATEREGLAEAAAIKAKAKALADNPLLVKLIHEQQWNGSLLTTAIGGNQQLLVSADKLMK